MTRRFLLVSAGGLFAASVLAFAVTASSWKPATALTNCTTSTAALDGDETSVAIAINQHRASQGLAPLLISPALSRASAFMSVDQLNGGAPHVDSFGRNPSQRAQDCDYPAGAGENMAIGFSASGVVTAWMNSAGHRNNILSGYYKVMGVGRTGNSWTMKFGAVVDDGAYSAGSPAPPPPAATSTPSPATGASGSGTNPPPTQAPSSDPAVAAGSAGQGNTAPQTPYRTVLPSSGGNSGKPQYALPSHFPYKRATILMIASE